MVCPVIPAAAASATHVTVSAISCTVGLPVGLCSWQCWESVLKSGIPRAAAVCTGPADTALTRTWCGKGPSSAAKPRTTASKEALAGPMRW